MHNMIVIHVILKQPFQSWQLVNARNTKHQGIIVGRLYIYGTYREEQGVTPIPGFSSGAHITQTSVGRAVKPIQPSIYVIKKQVEFH